MRPDQPSDPQRIVAELPTGPFTRTDVGSGPVVVAIHGLPGSVRDWRWTGPLLEPHCRFIRLDLPGFGETPSYVAPFGTASQAGFVAAVLDALDLHDVTLLGHSFGTATALRCAARYPERIARVALMAPIGFRPHREFRKIRAPRLIATLLRTPWIRRGMYPLLHRAFQAGGFPASTTYDEINATMQNIANHDFSTMPLEVSRLDAPVWAAWARDDHLVEPEIPEELLEACPDGPRLVFDEGGHNIQKTRAVECVESLRGFIRGE